MPSLFPSDPGTYAKIDGGGGAAIIEIDGILPEDSLIVTKYSFAQKARVQYKPVLGGDIFVYPLGNEMGVVQISGIVAFNMCNGGAGGGFTKLAQFFEDNKASTVQNVTSPISITLPGLSNFTEKCYLEVLSITGVDPKNRVFGFDLLFKVAPKGGG